MQRLRWLFIWCMAVLWLPMSLHCAMDRVGLFASAPSCCSEDGKQKADLGCAERCDVLSHGGQKVANDPIKLSAPVFLAGLFAAIVLPRAPQIAAGISPETADSPPELSQIWQFDRRAALPARAPTVLS